MSTEPVSGARFTARTRRCPEEIAVVSSASTEAFIDARLPYTNTVSLVPSGKASDFSSNTAAVVDDTIFTSRVPEFTSVKAEVAPSAIPVALALSSTSMLRASASTTAFSILASAEFWLWLPLQPPRTPSAISADAIHAACLICFASFCFFPESED
jgi:hypothetical protein